MLKCCGFIIYDLSWEMRLPIRKFRLLVTIDPAIFKEAETDICFKGYITYSQLRVSCTLLVHKQHYTFIVDKILINLHVKLKDTLFINTEIQDDTNGILVFIQMLKLKFKIF